MTKIRVVQGLEAEILNLQSLRVDYQENVERLEKQYSERQNFMLLDNLISAMMKLSWIDERIELLSMKFHSQKGQE